MFFESADMEFYLVHNIMQGEIHRDAILMICILSMWLYPKAPRMCIRYIEPRSSITLRYSGVLENALEGIG